MFKPVLTCNQASRRAIPSFKDFRGSNPRPTAQEADALTTRPLRQFNTFYNGGRNKKYRQSYIKLAANA